MTAPSQTASTDGMTLLSRLLLTPASSASTAESTAALTRLDHDAFTSLIELACSNHVILRAMQVARNMLRDAGDELRAGWAEAALAEEHARIQHAIPFLDAVCSAFEQEGLDATVIKSLDHWPDLGSDLDMYTNAAPERVIELMTRRFDAQIAPRSWGDRLACKWNFNLPGLPEPIEFHIGRLGQTGEQITLAARLPRRSRRIQAGEFAFQVPAASDRLMISTLQRMYRHFYFRLCDIVDSLELAESGAIDYQDLRDSANACGIWEGVATYLAIVSDYGKRYRGTGIDLPGFVLDSARFGGEQIYVARGFLRVPILPQSALLYGTQLAGLLRRQELESSARLGLLPWLATAAAVGHKITGSDKGIW